MKKEKKKKKIVIISIICGLLLVVSLLFLYLKFFKNNKSVANIKVGEIETITLLDDSNEAEAAKLIKNNIVKVVNKVDDNTTITGTGFFIKEGYLLTNSHIVDIYGDLSIEYSDGSKKAAYLYSNSINYDIALLKVEDIKSKALLLGNSIDINVTDDVLSAGYIYNFNGEASISKGILSARRESNTLTYLQSDISLDFGSSGGPLFDAKGNVLGINTFVTPNRTFALSLSSESLKLIAGVLIENPVIEYLTEERPSNAINSILVEVGYTDLLDLELYNDKDIIKNNNKEYKGDVEKAENKEHTSLFPDSSKTEEYYCDKDYILIGNNCIKEITYEPTRKRDACKEGYTQDEEFCVKTIVEEPRIEYFCTSDNLKLNSQNKCIFEGYRTDFGFTNESRIGSCPKGKKCYRTGLSDNELEFIDYAKCPSGSNEITQDGTIYIWNNEKLDESNYKTLNKRPVYGHLKDKDSDGLIYYQATTGLHMAVNCYTDILTDSKGNKIYKFLTYDELKTSACKEGTLKVSKDSNGIQGFYCKLDVNPSYYAYDVICYDDDAEVWQEKEGKNVFCRKWVRDEYDSVPLLLCKEGYALENNKCKKVNSYLNQYKLYCKEDDQVRGEVCVKTELLFAKKK